MPSSHLLQQKQQETASGNIRAVIPARPNVASFAGGPARPPTLLSAFAAAKAVAASPTDAAHGHLLTLMRTDPSSHTSGVVPLSQTNRNGGGAEALVCVSQRRPPGDALKAVGGPESESASVAHNVVHGSVDVRLEQPRRISEDERHGLSAEVPELTLHERRYVGHQRVDDNISGNRSPASSMHLDRHQGRPSNCNASAFLHSPPSPQVTAIGQQAPATGPCALQTDDSFSTSLPLSAPSSSSAFSFGTSKKSYVEGLSSTTSSGVCQPGPRYSRDLFLLPPGFSAGVGSASARPFVAKTPSVTGTPATLGTQRQCSNSYFGAARPKVYDVSTVEPAPCSVLASTLTVSKANGPGRSADTTHGTAEGKRYKPEIDGEQDRRVQDNYGVIPIPGASPPCAPSSPLLTDCNSNRVGPSSSLSSEGPERQLVPVSLGPKLCVISPHPVQHMSPASQDSLSTTFFSKTENACGTLQSDADRHTFKANLLNVTHVQTPQTEGGFSVSLAGRQGYTTGEERWHTPGRSSPQCRASEKKNGIRSMASPAASLSLSPSSSVPVDLPTQEFSASILPSTNENKLPSSLRSSSPSLLSVSNSATPSSACLSASAQPPISGIAPTPSAPPVPMPISASGTCGMASGSAQAYCASTIPSVQPQRAFGFPSLRESKSSGFAPALTSSSTLRPRSATSFSIHDVKPNSSSEPLEQQQQRSISTTCSASCSPSVMGAASIRRAVRPHYGLTCPMSVSPSDAPVLPVGYSSGCAGVAASLSASPSPASMATRFSESVSLSAPASSAPACSQRGSSSLGASPPGEYVYSQSSSGLPAVGLGRKYGGMAPSGGCRVPPPPPPPHHFPLGGHGRLSSSDALYHRVPLSSTSSSNSRFISDNGSTSASGGSGSSTAVLSSTLAPSPQQLQVHRLSSAQSQQFFSTPPPATSVAREGSATPTANGLRPCLSDRRSTFPVFSTSGSLRTSPLRSGESRNDNINFFNDIKNITGPGDEAAGGSALSISPLRPLSINNKAAGGQPSSPLARVSASESSETGKMTGMTTVPQQLVEEAVQMVQHPHNRGSCTTAMSNNDACTTSSLTGLPLLSASPLASVSFLNTRAPSAITSPLDDQLKSPEDGCCAVCWERTSCSVFGPPHDVGGARRYGEKLDDGLSQRLVMCAGCGLRVHPNCYGISEEELEKTSLGSTRNDGGEDGWYCSVCEYWRSRCEEAVLRLKKSRLLSGHGCYYHYHPMQCVLCLQSGGALRIGPENLWVHVQCVLYCVEGPYFALTSRLQKPMGLRQFLGLHQQRRFACALCHRSEGFSTRCGFPGCGKRVHIPCAFRSGLKPKLEVVRLGPLRGTTSCGWQARERLVKLVVCVEHNARHHRVQASRYQAQLLEYADLLSSRSYSASSGTGGLHHGVEDTLIFNNDQGKRGGFLGASSPGGAVTTTSEIVEQESATVTHGSSSAKRRRYRPPGSNALVPQGFEAESVAGRTSVLGHGGLGSSGDPSFSGGTRMVMDHSQYQASLPSQGGSDRGTENTPSRAAPFHHSHHQPSWGGGGGACAPPLSGSVPLSPLPPSHILSKPLRRRWGTPAAPTFSSSPARYLQASGSGTGGGALATESSGAESGDPSSRGHSRGVGGTSGAGKVGLDGESSGDASGCPYLMSGRGGKDELFPISRPPRVDETTSNFFLKKVKKRLQGNAGGESATGPDVRRPAQGSTASWIVSREKKSLSGGRQNGLDFKDMADRKSLSSTDGREGEGEARSGVRASSPNMLLSVQKSRDSKKLGGTAGLSHPSSRLLRKIGGTGSQRTSQRKRIVERSNIGNEGARRGASTVSVSFESNEYLRLDDELGTSMGSTSTSRRRSVATVQSDPDQSSSELTISEDKHFSNVRGEASATQRPCSSASAHGVHLNGTGTRKQRQRNPSYSTITSTSLARTEGIFTGARPRDNRGRPRRGNRVGAPYHNNQTSQHSTEHSDAEQRSAQTPMHLGSGAYIVQRGIRLKWARCDAYFKRIPFLSQYLGGLCQRSETVTLADAFARLSGNSCIPNSEPSLENLAAFLVASDALPTPEDLQQALLEQVEALVAVMKGDNVGGSAMPTTVECPTAPTVDTVVPPDPRVHVSFSGMVLLTAQHHTETSVQKIHAQRSEQLNSVGFLPHGRGDELEWSRQISSFETAFEKSDPLGSEVQDTYNSDNNKRHKDNIAEAEGASTGAGLWMHWDYMATDAEDRQSSLVISKPAGDKHINLLQKSLRELIAKIHASFPTASIERRVSQEVPNGQCAQEASSLLSSSPNWPFLLESGKTTPESKDNIKNRNVWDNAEFSKAWRSLTQECPALPSAVFVALLVLRSGSWTRFMKAAKICKKSDGAGGVCSSVGKDASLQHEEALKDYQFSVKKSHFVKTEQDEIAAQLRNRSSTPCVCGDSSDMTACPEESTALSHEKAVIINGSLFLADEEKQEIRWRECLNRTAFDDTFPVSADYLLALIEDLLYFLGFQQKRFALLTPYQMRLVAHRISQQKRAECAPSQRDGLEEYYDQMKAKASRAERTRLKMHALSVHVIARPLRILVSDVHQSPLSMSYTSGAALGAPMTPSTAGPESRDVIWVLERCSLEHVTEKEADTVFQAEKLEDRCKQKERTFKQPDRFSQLMKIWRSLTDVETQRLQQQQQHQYSAVSSSCMTSFGILGALRAAGMSHDTCKATSDVEGSSLVLSAGASKVVNSPSAYTRGCVSICHRQQKLFEGLMDRAEQMLPDQQQGANRIFRNWLQKSFRNGSRVFVPGAGVKAFQLSYWLPSVAWVLSPCPESHPVSSCVLSDSNEVLSLDVQSIFVKGIWSTVEKDGQQPCLSNEKVVKADVEFDRESGGARCHLSERLGETASEEPLTLPSLIIPKLPLFSSSFEVACESQQNSKTAGGGLVREKATHSTGPSLKDHCASVPDSTINSSSAPTSTTMSTTKGTCEPKETALNNPGQDHSALRYRRMRGEGSVWDLHCFEPDVATSGDYGSLRFVEIQSQFYLGFLKHIHERLDAIRSAYVSRILAEEELPPRIFEGPNLPIMTMNTVFLECGRWNRVISHCTWGFGDQPDSEFVRAQQQITSEAPSLGAVARSSFLKSDPTTVVSSLVPGGAGMTKLISGSSCIKVQDQGRHGVLGAVDRLRIPATRQEDNSTFSACLVLMGALNASNHHRILLDPLASVSVAQELLLLPPFAMSGSRIKTCAVCFGPEWDSGNPISTCSRCCVTVHRGCYAIPDVSSDEEETFFCKRCEFERSRTGTAAAAAGTNASTEAPGAGLKGSEKNGNKGCHTVGGTTKTTSLSASSSGPPGLCASNSAGGRSYGSSHGNSFIAGSIRCDFCNTLGGALKRTRDGRWIHLTCAFFLLPEVIPGDIKRLDDWDVDGLQSWRMGRACSVCAVNQATDALGLGQRHKDSKKGLFAGCATTSETPPVMYRLDSYPPRLSEVPPHLPLLNCVRGVRGACVQCAHDGCSRVFHPMCAWLSGMYVRPYRDLRTFYDWKPYGNTTAELYFPKFRVEVKCFDHSPSSLLPAQPQSFRFDATALLNNPLELKSFFLGSLVSVGTDQTHRDLFSAATHVIPWTRSAAYQRCLRHRRYINRDLHPHLCSDILASSAGGGSSGGARGTSISNRRGETPSGVTDSSAEYQPHTSTRDANHSLPLDVSSGVTEWRSFSVELNRATALGLMGCTQERNSITVTVKVLSDITGSAFVRNSAHCAATIGSPLTTDVHKTCLTSFPDKYCDRFCAVCYSQNETVMETSTSRAEGLQRLTGEDTLLHCRRCGLAVHRRCYGASSAAGLMVFREIAKQWEPIVDAVSVPLPVNGLASAATSLSAPYAVGGESSTDALSVTLTMAERLLKVPIANAARMTALSQKEQAEVLKDQEVKQMNTLSLEKDFICDVCQQCRSLDDLSCAVCPRRGGAFKVLHVLEKAFGTHGDKGKHQQYVPTPDEEIERKPAVVSVYVHATCATYCPGLPVGRLDDVPCATEGHSLKMMRASSLCDVHHCVICGLSRGVVLPCTAIGCETRAHALCLRLNGCFIECHRNAEYDGTASVVAFCPTHSRQRKERVVKNPPLAVFDSLRTLCEEARLHAHSLRLRVKAKALEVDRIFQPLKLHQPLSPSFADNGNSSVGAEGFFVSPAVENSRGIRTTTRGYLNSGSHYNGTLLLSEENHVPCNIPTWEEKNEANDFNGISGYFGPDITLELSLDSATSNTPNSSSIALKYGTERHEEEEEEKSGCISHFHLESPWVENNSTPEGKKVLNALSSLTPFTLDELVEAGQFRELSVVEIFDLSQKLLPEFQQRRRGRPSVRENMVRLLAQEVFTRACEVTGLPGFKGETFVLKGLRGPDVTTINHTISPQQDSLKQPTINGFTSNGSELPTASKTGTYSPALAKFLTPASPAWREAVQIASQYNRTVQSILCGAPVALTAIDYGGSSGTGTSSSTPFLRRDGSYISSQVNISESVVSSFAPRSDGSANSTPGGSDANKRLPSDTGTELVADESPRSCKRILTDHVLEASANCSDTRDSVSGDLSQQRKRRRTNSEENSDTNFTHEPFIKIIEDVLIPQKTRPQDEQPLGTTFCWFKDATAPKNRDTLKVEESKDQISTPSVTPVSPTHCENRQAIEQGDNTIEEPSILLASLAEHTAALDDESASSLPPHSLAIESTGVLISETPLELDRVVASPVTVSETHYTTSTTSLASQEKVSRSGEDVLSYHPTEPPSPQGLSLSVCPVFVSPTAPPSAAISSIETFELSPGDNGLLTAKKHSSCAQNGMKSYNSLESGGSSSASPRTTYGVTSSQPVTVFVGVEERKEEKAAHSTLTEPTPNTVEGIDPECGVISISSHCVEHPTSASEVVSGPPKPHDSSQEATSASSLCASMDEAANAEPVETTTVSTEEVTTWLATQRPRRRCSALLLAQGAMTPSSLPLKKSRILSSAMATSFSSASPVNSLPCTSFASGQPESANTNSGTTHKKRKSLVSLVSTTSSTSQTSGAPATDRAANHTLSPIPELTSSRPQLRKLGENAVVTATAENSGGRGSNVGHTVKVTRSAPLRDRKGKFIASISVAAGGSTQTPVRSPLTASASSTAVKTEVNNKSTGSDDAATPHVVILRSMKKNKEHQHLCKTGKRAEASQEAVPSGSKRGTGELSTSSSFSALPSTPSEATSSNSRVQQHRRSVSKTQDSMSNPPAGSHPHAQGVDSHGEPPSSASLLLSANNEIGRGTKTSTRKQRRVLRSSASSVRGSEQHTLRSTTGEKQSDNLTPAVIVDTDDHHTPVSSRRQSLVGNSNASQSDSGGPVEVTTDTNNSNVGRAPAASSSTRNRRMRRRSTAASASR